MECKHHETLSERKRTSRNPERTRQLGISTDMYGKKRDSLLQDGKAYPIRCRGSKGILQNRRKSILMMVYYTCDANHLRSFPKISRIHEPLTALGANRKSAGQRGSTRGNKNALVNRRKIVITIPEKGEKARPEAEKESLKYNRISTTIPSTGEAICE